MPQYSGAQYSAPFSEHAAMPQYSQAPLPVCYSSLGFSGALSLQRHQCHRLSH
jgi:hypothetical protein